MEETLMKLAKAIEKGCGKGHCPCEENCIVYTYEECLNRIVDWLKKVVEAESFEVE